MMVKPNNCPKVETCLYADTCLETKWVECKYKPVQCPFCFEPDFDRIGLKSHLTNGDCLAFNEIESTKRVFG
jgi:hypothetical protein